MNTSAKKWLFAALLLCLPLQVLPAMSQKSPTSDEFAHHLASGFSHLVKRDFRMNPAMPPLPRLLTAVPMVLLGARGPWDDPSWATGNSPDFARAFFYHANAHIPLDRLIFWARLPVLLVSMAFAALVFWWARRLAGPVAGFAAMTLYVFCPDVVAHSGLATSDLCVAFFFFSAIVAFERFLRSPDDRKAVGTAVLTGAALLSKFTAVLLVPVFVLIAVVAGKWRTLTLRRTAVFAVVGVFTVWAGYFFEVKPLLENTPDPAKKEAFLEKMGGPALVEWARRPLPLTTFAASLSGMVFTRAKGTNAFLLGEWSTKGWWYYYLVAFFVKNTLPFLLLILLTVVLARRLPLDRIAWAAIAVPILFFFLITLPDRAQAGIRYFLPIYPLFFTACGAAVAWIWQSAHRLRPLAAALLAWHALEAAAIAPDSLAYFNQTVGGPDGGHRILRDSNIDWGQDLKGLGRYVRDHGIPEVALLYYGSVSPESYGIPWRNPANDEFETPRAAVYAVAVHNLNAMKWADRISPDARIGHSIYVYDLRHPKDPD